MDIFDAPRRTKEDCIKKPMNYPSPDITEKQLQERNQQQTLLFDIFLKNLYMKFDYKVNSCKSRCLPAATNYEKVFSCWKECEDGAVKMSSYADSRLRQMQQLLGQCVANANGLHNSLDEIYYCYQLYNNGFSKLKQFITEESMYYQ